MTPAGLTVIRDGEMHRERQVGKVQALVDAVQKTLIIFKDA